MKLLTTVFMVLSTGVARLQLVIKNRNWNPWARSPNGSAWHDDDSRYQQPSSLAFIADSTQSKVFGWW